VSEPEAGNAARSGHTTQPLIWWYGLMVLGGIGFGLLSDRRPFGEGILVHPLVMFFILVGLGLIAVRVLLAQPVPSVISDRALITGCVVGLIAFLGGNFLGVHVFARP
jgi:hypothetical protein